MKKIIAILLIMGMMNACSWICTSLTHDRLQAAQSALHLIQSNYQPLIEMFELDLPLAAIILAGADIALNALGTMIESGCADDIALENAEIVASQVQQIVLKAKQQGLIQ